MENHTNYKIQIWISTHLSTFEPEFRNFLSTFEPEFKNFLSTPRLSQKKGVLINKKCVLETFLFSTSVSYLDW